MTLHVTHLFIKGIWFLCFEFDFILPGNCDFKPINATKDITVDRKPPDKETSPCVWLISTRNHTSRIEASVNNFGTTAKDSLMIGNGLNSSNDDSIFIKLKGSNHSLIMVSSGPRIWIKYHMVVGNATSNAMFNIRLDVYKAEGNYQSVWKISIIRKLCCYNEVTFLYYKMDLGRSYPGAPNYSTVLICQIDRFTYIRFASELTI